MIETYTPLFHLAALINAKFNEKTRDPIFGECISI
jgi:hypothetical protein